MQKLNRLGWVVGRSYRCQGVDFGVRANSEEALQAAVAYLPPRTVETGLPEVDHLASVRLVAQPRPDAVIRPYHLAYQGRVQTARSFDPREVLETMEAELALVIAEHAVDRLFVHAGVVALNGQALVLPGKTFTGKSTLVVELVKRGAVFYSDEFAVLDSTGRVEPYPRRIQIRVGSSGATERMTAEDIGGETGRDPLPVKLVALCRYRAGAALRLRVLPPGRAALEMVAGTVPVRARPEWSLDILRNVVLGATVVQGVRGEAGPAADRLLRMLARP